MCFHMYVHQNIKKCLYITDENAFARSEIKFETFLLQWENRRWFHNSNCNNKLLLDTSGTLYRKTLIIYSRIWKKQQHFLFEDAIH